ncbi:TM221 protein, partial [Sapayoa aenigma]|nr:TM221 protein [Sapayoa aenigma]
IGQLPAALESWFVPSEVLNVLFPLTTVLATLCLVLNVSCLLLCLLHGYLSVELCRGQPGSARADWFLDSQKVRHAAIGLFCCGVCLYLTGKGSAHPPPAQPTLAIYIPLRFRGAAGIAGACVLASGVIVLLVTVTHALLRVLRLSRHSRPEASHSPHEDDSAQQGESSASDLQGRDGAVSRPRPEIHRAFSFPAFLESKSQL